MRSLTPTKRHARDLLHFDVSHAAPPVVPELDVADLARSLRFYVGALGFGCRTERPEERFATRQAVVSITTMTPHICFRRC
jgi:hypothetical protein